jgi:hypothetical protein
MEKFIKFIKKKFGVTGEEIIGRSQRWTVAEAKSVFCCLGSRELEITGRELSRALGLTPAAIHYAIVRGENLLEEDEDVEEGVIKYLKNLPRSPWGYFPF